MMLGNAYFYLGNYEKALEYYQRELSIQEDILEEDDPNLQDTREFIEEVKSKLQNK